MAGDTGRYREIPGDTGRYQEIRDTGGYGQNGEIRGDTGRCEEMQGDTGRYGQILERYFKIPQKTVRTSRATAPRLTRGARAPTPPQLLAL